MAFPTVAAVGTAHTTTTNQTSKSINCPAASAGDRLLLIMAWDGNRTVTVSNVNGQAWTQVFDSVCGGGAARLHVYEIVSLTAAISSQTVTVTLSATEMGGAQIIAVRGSDSATATAASTADTGTDAAPDPASLTPSWGSADTLWLAVAGYDQGQTTVSAYPTNYTNGTNVRANNTGGAGMGYARRALAASSEDPGTFTLSTSRAHAAVTLAIRPAPPPAPTIAVQGSSHGHSATAPVLTQTAVLAPQGATHSHSSGAPTLTGVITPASASHGHTAGNAGLTQVSSLAIDSAAHDIPPFPTINYLLKPRPYPWIAATGTAHTTTTDGTSKTVNVPAHQKGDILLLIMAWDGNPTVSVSAVGGQSWLNYPATAPSSSARLQVSWLRAASDGSSQDVTVTLGASEAGAAQVLVIRGGFGVTTRNSSANTGTSTSPTFSSVDRVIIRYQREDLGFTYLGYDDGTATVTAYPSNYTGTNIRADSASGAGLGYAHRNLPPEDAASIEQPGDATLSASKPWVAFPGYISPALMLNPWENGRDEIGVGSDHVTLTQDVLTQAAGNPTTHGHSAGSPTLTQTAVIVAASSTHSHMAAAASLTLRFLATVAGASHGHSAGSPALTLRTPLTVAGTQHSHTASVVTLSSEGQLGVSFATHGLSSPVVTLTTIKNLGVNGAAHLHTTGGVSLVSLGGIQVADSIHLLVTDNANLLQVETIQVEHSGHDHQAALLVLTEPILTIDWSLVMARRYVGLRNAPLVWRVFPPGAPFPPTILVSTDGVVTEKFRPTGVEMENAGWVFVGGRQARIEQSSQVRQYLVAAGYTLKEAT
jgi:hypothetical protein